jgi:NadR type nicotinamide-nucleotide adenylyltransferase
MSIKKIVLIGAESTGKTTLANNLAVHYQTNIVAEFAREYLTKTNGQYSITELDSIAAGQLSAETKAMQTANNLLFIDTNLYTIKIWSEVKYNSCSKYILDNIVDRCYDYYLLCDIDLDWQYDTLRESPSLHSRKKLMHYYTDAIMNSGVPFSIVQGKNEDRTKNAIQLLQKFLG